MNDQTIIQQNQKHYSRIIIRIYLLLTGLVLLALFSSCSSIPAYMYSEPIQELLSDADHNKIDNQSELVTFLEEIINSDEYFTIEAFGRKTFSHHLKQTNLLTHSFYLINSNNGNYYTLSFSGSTLSPYSAGYWVLNKDVDLSSYKLFAIGNNIWDVVKIFSEQSIDAYQTIKNIICAINTGANYYFLDHYKKKENHFNCNTAVSETIAIEEELRTAKASGRNRAVMY